MKKAFSLLIIPFLLLLSGCKQEDKGLKEECENFQLLGIFNKGEKIKVSFNSELIHEDFFEDKAWGVSHKLCVVYTDTFAINLLVVKGERKILDTTMVGYSKNGDYLLTVPYGLPKPEIADKVWADTTGKLYEEIPRDSLIRKAILEPGLIHTDLVSN